MQLTAEQREIGKANFNEAVGFTRRSFLAGAAAAGPALGAVYFGYEALKGDPVKVGFIGTGDEGNILITQHPPAYMDIVAVADIRPSNRLRVMRGDNNEHRIGLVRKLGAKKAKSIEVFSDHKELLKNAKRLGIEAVVIAVPLNLHAAIAIDAMDAGLHVLGEKLMAHDVMQCKQMIRKANETPRRLLAIGHQRHYSVLYDNATDLIRKGLLGDIKFIHAQWHRNNSWPKRDSWRKPIAKEDTAALAGKLDTYDFKSMNELINWRLYYRTGGGLMVELGAHQLDAASIFLGGVRPLAVQGYGGRNFYGVKGVGSKDKQADDREIDDNIYVTFEFPGPNYADDHNDIVIVTYSSISTNSLEGYGETVLGSRASLIVNHEREAQFFKESGGGKPGGLDYRLWVIKGRDGGPVLDTYETSGPATAAAMAGDLKVSRGYTEEMEHLCHCIRTKNFAGPDQGGLRCNGQVGLEDAVMALTANLAMKHKKRIVFKPEWFDPTSDAAPEIDPEIVG